jgi:hypothetical protein
LADDLALALQDDPGGELHELDVAAQFGDLL